VRVVDARRVYGRLEYLVEPLLGDGQAWVQAAKCTLTGEEILQGVIKLYHANLHHLRGSVWERPKPCAKASAGQG
jgi:hypothetical protein